VTTPVKVKRANRFGGVRAQHGRRHLALVGGGPQSATSRSDDLRRALLCSMVRIASVDPPSLDGAARHRPRPPARHARCGRGSQGQSQVPGPQHIFQGTRKCAGDAGVSAHVFRV